MRTEKASPRVRLDVRVFVGGDFLVLKIIGESKKIFRVIGAIVSLGNRSGLVT